MFHTVSMNPQITMKTESQESTATVMTRDKNIVLQEGRQEQEQNEYIRSTTIGLLVNVGRDCLN